MADSKKPRVLFINGAVYLPGEGGYKRTLYLFNMMRELGYQVTLLTSDFNHYAKKQRDVKRFREEYPDFSDIEIVHITPYKKNVSVKRWYSGVVWCREVTKWVKGNIQNYDVIYQSMPDIPTTQRVGNICHASGKKLVVDIRDLFPEVLRVFLKKDTLYKVLTYPLKRSADRCYAAADELVAVSNEYLQRGLIINKKSVHPTVVYIGAVFDKFYTGIEKYAAKIEKPKDETWVTYAGTLGSTYDLYTLMDAAKLLMNIGKNHIVFKILGQGPEGDSLKRYAAEKGLQNVDFVGFVEYEMMAAYLSKSDMTVNSVKRRASQSIINKVADYFAAGIPCLNGSLCHEMQQLIIGYKAGLNFEPENVDSLVEAILMIDDNKVAAKEYGANAKKLAIDKFDRSVTYPQIISLLDGMIEE